MFQIISYKLYVSMFFYQKWLYIAFELVAYELLLSELRYFWYKVLEVIGGVKELGLILFIAGGKKVYRVKLSKNNVN